MKNIMRCCTLCPRECKIDRTNNEIGLCGVSNIIKVARIAPHYYEEPPISGKSGSGAIFFSGCNLKCIYCQNYDISKYNFGKSITITKLAEKMIQLQNTGVHNINLVTPTHYIPQIKKAIIKAKKMGLDIPIVYNTSSYEKVSSLKLLDGLIDVYLPDLKYFDDILAIKYSKAPNYFNIAIDAIEEMYKQTGPIEFDKNGMIKKGVIVRHLLLPGQIEDSKKILKYLNFIYNNNIFISIMNQYTPLDTVKNIPELNKTVTEKEYDELINYACDLGIKNAFIQEGKTCEESFIPKFDLTGIK